MISSDLAEGLEKPISEWIMMSKKKVTRWKEELLSSIKHPISIIMVDDWYNGFVKII